MYRGIKAQEKLRRKVTLLLVLMLLLLTSSVACSLAPDSTQPSTEQIPALVTKDASDIVLRIHDFEPDWTQRDAKAVAKEGAVSAYQVYFHKGVFYPPVVQNIVAVYPTIDMAEQVYLAEKPQNVSLEYPPIGDECLLDSSIPTNQRLVFRKSNVVVWLWLQQDPFGEIESYAKIVESKIG